MNRDFDVEQDYFQWLCDLVGAEKDDQSYKLLAHDLYKTEFYSLVSHDENRAMDGIALREEYLSEVNYPKYVRIEGPCNVLEMLIGLARRMDYEAGNDDLEDDRTAEWFWILIENLGLDAYCDEEYVDRNGMKNVDIIVRHFLERDYRWDGFGGLFPLNYAVEDQRKVEIWYQMNAFLIERDAV